MEITIDTKNKNGETLGDVIKNALYSYNKKNDVFDFDTLCNFAVDTGQDEDVLLLCNTKEDWNTYFKKPSDVVDVIDVLMEDNHNKADRIYDYIAINDNCNYTFSSVDYFLINCTLGWEVDIDELIEYCIDEYYNGDYDENSGDVYKIIDKFVRNIQ